jgi:hypothetical protein
MTRDQVVTAAQEIDRVYLEPVSKYARQSDTGINNPHLRWMVEQIGGRPGLVPIAGMTTDKAQRWLGYIQGVLVAQGRASLVEMKQLNKRAAAAVTGDARADVDLRS